MSSRNNIKWTTPELRLLKAIAGFLIWLYGVRAAVGGGDVEKNEDWPIWKEADIILQMVSREWLKHSWDMDRICRHYPYMTAAKLHGRGYAVCAEGSSNWRKLLKEMRFLAKVFPHLASEQDLQPLRRDEVLPTYDGRGIPERMFAGKGSSSSSASSDSGCSASASSPYMPAKKNRPIVNDMVSNKNIDKIIALLIEDRTVLNEALETLTEEVIRVRKALWGIHYKTHK